MNVYKKLALSFAHLFVTNFLPCIRSMTNCLANWCVSKFELCGNGETSTDTS